MKIGKKGLVMSTSVWIILVLVITVMLLAVVYVWQEELTGGIDSKQCKIEVNRVAYASKISGMKDKYLQAYCPSHNLGLLDLPKDQEKARREVAITLVNEMVDCWDKFGEGKLNPIKGELTQQETHCFICAEFTTPSELVNTNAWMNFQNDINAVLRIDDDSNRFLKQAIPRADSGERLYYAAEVDVNNEMWGPDMITFTFFPELALQKEKSYYLTNVFIVNKEQALLTNFNPFNTFDVMSQLVFVEESNLENVCENLEN